MPSASSATSSRQGLQERTGIAICYEDNHLAIVWKPAGILTVGGTGSGEPSVSAALPTLFPTCAPPAEAGDAIQGRLIEPESTLTAAAKDLWFKKPGVGMQEMLSTIHAHWPQQAAALGSRTAVKQLVRVAIAAIPYRRCPDAADAQPVFTKTSMVETLLAQRQAHRAAREWVKADKLRVGLEGIGVRIDDKLKTWTLGPLPELTSVPVSTEPANGERSDQSVSCSMCGGLFATRNRLFKHLRDATTSCGLTVAAGGGIAPGPIDARADPSVRTTAAPGTTSARLVLGPLVLAKSVAGMVMVAITDAGYKHVHKQLRESRVRLDWQAMVHGYFPPNDTCVRVLQRSRGTHVRGGHLTLVQTSVLVDNRTNMGDGEQPSTQVLRALDRLGHPVVGEQSRKSQGLVLMAASGSGTTQADDGRGRCGRSSTLLSLVRVQLPGLVAESGSDNLIEAQHQPPSRFAVLVEREQTQWDKRERQIADLQRAVAKASLVLSKTGPPLDHTSLPLPAAYEVGAALFCGLTFQLGRSRAVMIPRPSTEALVRAAVAEITGQLHNVDGPMVDSAKRVLDLGCGSGNVLLSIMHYCQAPAWVQGVGIDLSPEAVELSRANAAFLLSSQGQRSVNFVTGDFGRVHELVTEDRPRGPFDVVVCNPPYLDQGMQDGLASMAPELLAEPPAALFAADGGTAAYTRIIASLAACEPPMLAPDAVLLFELGKGTELAVQAAIDGLGIGCRCSVIEPPRTLEAAGVRGDLAGQVGQGRGFVLEVRGLNPEAEG